MICSIILIMSLWIIGLVLGSFSIFLKVLGTNLQKLSHKNKERSYFRNIHWVAGFALVIIGSVLDMTALAFAPQSLIASLGGFTLVVNIGVAKLLLGEAMRKIQYGTTLVIVGGTLLTIVYSPKTEANNDVNDIKKMYESYNFIVYGIFTIFIIGSIRILNYFFRKSDSHKRLRSILVPISSGTIAAQNMFFAKTFMRLLSHSIEYKTTEVIKEYIIYINLVCLIFCLVSHVKWLNEALKEFKSTLVVPINKSSWIIVSILAGIFVMGEGFVVENDSSEDEQEDTSIDQFMFVIGIITIIFGLILHSLFERVQTEEHIEIEEISLEEINLDEIPTLSIQIVE